MNNDLNNNNNFGSSNTPFPNTTPNNNQNFGNNNINSMENNTVFPGNTNITNADASNIVNSNPTPINNINTPNPNPNTSNTMNVNSTPINNAINQNNNPSPINNVNAAPINIQSFNNQQSQPIYNNEVVSDEELLRVFIGNNYEKITTKPFNFAGFVFSFFYMFYRKMFLYGLLVFILNLIILNVIHNTLVSLVFNILIGLFINKLYVYYAKNKIKKIKENNSQKSDEELKRICSSTGGTSIGKIFLGGFVVILIAIVVLVIMTVMGFTSIFGSLLSSNGSFDFSSGTNGVYEGMLQGDTSVDINEEFSVTIPNKFEESLMNADYKIDYKYEGTEGVFNDCAFSLYAVKGYSSAENLINQMKEYYVSDNPSNVTNTTMNGILWYTFHYTGTFGETYYYGTTKNNKVYLVEYEIQEDAPSTCSSYRNQIMNSIRSK